MAKDPMFSNRTSPNGATAPNDPLNDSHKRYFRGYNKFNLTRQFYNTERYADINIVEVLEGVEGDTLPFGNKHYLRSYTLKAPMMFDIYKKKTYFAVNNQAILPINWKKVYKQPNKGDDVDPDLVNCVSTFLYDVWNFFYQIKLDSNTIDANQNNYNYIWRVILLLESIFSNGSLLSSMNCHLSNMINVSGGSSFDAWLEETYNHFDGSANSGYLQVILPQLGNKTLVNYSGSSDPSAIRVSIRYLLDNMRTFSDFVVPYFASFSSQFNYLVDRLKMLSLRFDDNGDFSEQSIINLSRLIAYQLVCVQFYSRDSVDNIYNAESFIDNAKSTVIPFLNITSTGDTTQGNKWPTFDYNGTRYDYDVFSGFVINTVFMTFFNDYLFRSSTSSFSNMLNAYNYLHMIFFYRKSLRYGDYFSGAKTLPYAPMDVTADVVGNGVSALNMTRSIIAQRFANLVERVSNTWNDYLDKVTGGKASPTPFEPRFLASSTSSVNGFEVENTGSDQFSNQNVSTLLKSGNSNYIYEVEVNEPMIIIGVSTYEVPRVYSATVSRFFKHTDRFNMFNKSFQNIGDQEITQNERNSAFSPLVPFGYTPRHMEYKQRYPIASGGFVDNLPGYAFITDNNESNQNEIDLGDDVKISSYYLRNRNSEFDRFYSNLTGLTLASYFHFIVKYDLICHARRQMEYAPDIL